MTTYTITTGSACSYTDVVVVADDRAHAEVMLTEWCKECTDRETDACYVEGEGMDKSDFIHTFSHANLLEVDPADLADYAEYSNSGVYMIKSGLNG